jgi:AcrR family transcriptional regulator
VEQSTRRLLEAAAGLVASQGYARTTAAQIAEQAGYSREMVRVRFGSKEALIEELLATDFQGWLRLDVRGLPDALSRLLAMVQRLTDLAAEADQFVRAVFVLNFEAVAVPALQPAMRTWLSTVERTFAGHLRDGVADGSIRDDIDPESQARLLVAAAVGSSYAYLIDLEHTDPAEILREAVLSLAAVR